MRTPDSGRHWPLRDQPALLWLLIAAVVALVHRAVPESTWLMVHLVMLGALTHAILVWSTHFSQALLKTPAHLDSRRRQSARLLMLLTGTTAVLVGVPSGVWALVVAGAVTVACAVGWHAWALLRRLRRALPGRFRVTVRYYLCAAACLPVGATFGAWLALGGTEEWRGRLLLAHTMTMALGWVGLTVTGTLLTLWPTMLRTRIDARAEAWASQGLAPALISLAILDTGALTGLQWVAFGGALGYLGSWLWTARALWRPARQAPPKRFATWSATAALGWFAVVLVLVPLDLARADTWAAVPDGYGLITPALVAGFAVQLLSGALAHLIPVVLGGGARTARAAQAPFDRGAAARVIAANGGLALSLAPVPSWVRVTCSIVVLAALAWFLVAAGQSVRAAIRTKARLDAEREAGTVLTEPLAPERGIFTAGQLVAATGALVLAVVAGVAVDPAAAGIAAGDLGSARSSAAGVGIGVGVGAAASDAGSVATAHTTRVRVEAKDMRFHPGRIEVPRGDRLEVEVVNTDGGNSHDLVFPSGARTKRIDPGGSDVVDAGVIDADLQAWCGIIGHRQMGMVLDVRVIGPAAGSSTSGGHDAHAGTSTAVATQPAAPGLQLGQPAPADFRAVPAELLPLSAARTHRLTFTIEEVELEVAPGVRQKRWTFNGAVPGPTLHGRVGDVFDITLVNNGSMGHSIDFHAGDIAPDQPMRTIPPGASLHYRFTAHRSGVWMYHCSTMPMATHIAAGMHGAVIIEPEGLPAVDHSYVLVQSEVYVDGDGTQARDVDSTAVHAERPSAVVFNGVANQYDARPLTARAGERVRFWVLDAGPNRPSSFHVVGGQFDTVYAEGAYQLWRGHGPGTPGFTPAGATPGVASARTTQTTGTRGAGVGSAGSQALGLQAAQGGFVELVATEPGHYPFVTHIMVDAERGAHGILQVTR